MADPTAHTKTSANQGLHIMLYRSFLARPAAKMVPCADSGCSPQSIRWRGRTVVGTTSAPVPVRSMEPSPFHQQAALLLTHASRSLTQDPGATEVPSMSAGMRPLVTQGETGATASLSRDYITRISRSGLLTETRDEPPHDGGRNPWQSGTHWLAARAACGDSKTSPAWWKRCTGARATGHFWNGRVLSDNPDRADPGVGPASGRASAIPVGRALVECAPLNGAVFARLWALEQGRSPTWQEEQFRTYCRLAVQYPAARLVTVAPAIQWLPPTRCGHRWRSGSATRTDPGPASHGPFPSAQNVLCHE